MEHPIGFTMEFTSLGHDGLRAPAYPLTNGGRQVMVSSNRPEESVEELGQTAPKWLLVLAFRLHGLLVDHFPGSLRDIVDIAASLQSGEQGAGLAPG